MDNRIISNCIQAFKSITVRVSNKSFRWQRSFYDHIIRSEKSHLKIAEYIQNNPLSWELDAENDKAGKGRDKYYKELTD